MNDRPDWQSNCTINQSIDYRADWPRTCAYPRVQLYLPAGSLDLTLIQTLGQLNRTYRYDGYYYYLRSHAIANGTIALASFADRDLVEFDFSNPTAVTSELIWLTQSGVVSHFTPEDALRAGVGLSQGQHEVGYSSDPNLPFPALLLATPEQTVEMRSWPQIMRIDALRLRRLELPPITRSVSVPQPPLSQTPGNNCEGAGCPSNRPSPTPCTSADCANPSITLPVEPSSPSVTGQAAVAVPVPSSTSSASPSSAAGASAVSPSAWPFWIAPVLALLGILSLAVLAFYFRPQAVMAPQAPAPPTPIFLSDSRLALLSQLQTADRIPTDISTRLGKSKATVVEQLDGLVTAGLVERVSEPGRKFVFYRLTRAGRQALLQFQNEHQAHEPKPDEAA
jgi:DNA-binding MarR family transcriptional regulator